MASQSELGSRSDAATEAGIRQLAHERGMLQAAMAAGKAEAQSAGARSDAMEQAGYAQLNFENAMLVQAAGFNAKRWFLDRAQDVHTAEVAASARGTRSAVENVGREPAPQPVMMDHRLIDFLRQHAQHHASVPGDDGPIH